MTDEEKAMVMACTGICLLTGDKFEIFHRYVEHLMGRRMSISELPKLENEIKEKAKQELIKLCQNGSYRNFKNGVRKKLFSYRMFLAKAMEAHGGEGVVERLGEALSILDDSAIFTDEERKEAKKILYFDASEMISNFNKRYGG